MQRKPTSSGLQWVGKHELTRLTQLVPEISTVLRDATKWPYQRSARHIYFLCTSVSESFQRNDVNWDAKVQITRAANILLLELHLASEYPRDNGADHISPPFQRLLQIASVAVHLHPRSLCQNIQSKLRKLSMSTATNCLRKMQTIAKVHIHSDGITKSSNGDEQ